MKINLVMVMSLDGKTTRWNEDNVYTWTSKEDRIHFSKLMKDGTPFIMGEKTFEIMRKMITLHPKKFFVVFVPHPEKYKNLQVEDHLEFYSGNPVETVKKLERREYKKAFLIGGEYTNTSFFQYGLVDEILLTIEPKIFGIGNGLLSKEIFNLNLKLLEIRKLNKKGTLLLRYKVAYS